MVTGEVSAESWMSKDGEARATLVLTAWSNDILPLVKHDEPAPAAQVADDGLPF